MTGKGKEIMDTAGALDDMTERKILYRLVGDVEALKKDAENGSKSREITRAHMEAMQHTLTDVDRKLDQLLTLEERLKDAENGVADYRRDRTRLLSMVAGVGIGSGGLGALIGRWLARLWGG